MLSYYYTIVLIYVKIKKDKQPRNAQIRIIRNDANWRLWRNNEYKCKIGYISDTAVLAVYFKRERLLQKLKRSFPAFNSLNLWKLFGVLQNNYVYTGSIVNVSSVNGTRSFKGVLSYCISKAALDQFTKCAALGKVLHYMYLLFYSVLVILNVHISTSTFWTICSLFLELADKGVRVNSVNPGVIITDFQKRAGLNDQQYVSVSIP